MWSWVQCRICQRAESKDTWQATVQLRQKVPHRRTFLYLEQLILTHKAGKEALNIKEVKDGLDFFFATKQSGARFAAFLSSFVPTATKESGRVIGISHHVRPSVTHSLTHSAFLCRPLCAILPAADSSCWHQLAHPLPLNYRSFTNTALARLDSPPRVCVALLRCGCLSWRSLSVSLVGWLAGWLAGCRWGHPRHLSR